MKILVFILSSVLILISCEKDHRQTPRPPLAGSASFIIDNLITIT